MKNGIGNLKKGPTNSFKAYVWYAEKGLWSQFSGEKFLALLESIAEP